MAVLPKKPINKEAKVSAGTSTMPDKAVPMYRSPLSGPVYVKGSIIRGKYFLQSFEDTCQKS